MKRLLSILLISVLAISGVFAGGAGQTATASDTLELVVAHNQTSTDNPYQFGMNEFKRTIEELSGGKIIVTVHAGTLGTNESELIEKLQLGAVDLVVASPGFMTRIGVPEVDLFSLLYLFDGFDHWERSVDGTFGNQMKDIILQKTNNQFRIMGYWSSSVRHYYGSKPIVEPADAAGQRIRLQSSPVQQAFWSRTGAVPAQVGWGELYQALQQGTVDAAENDYTNFMLQDHHRTPNGRFISETGHDYTTRLFLMSGAKYDALTTQQKQWFDAAAAAATREERRVTYDMIEQSKAKVIADGAVVNQVNLPAFRALGVPIQDEFARTNNVTNLLQMIRANR